MNYHVVDPSLISQLKNAKVANGVNAGERGSRVVQTTTAKSSGNGRAAGTRNTGPGSAVNGSDGHKLFEFMSV